MHSQQTVVGAAAVAVAFSVWFGLFARSLALFAGSFAVSVCLFVCV